MRIEPPAWESVRELYVRDQGADGGWSYAPGTALDAGPTLTMTVAGLCGLHIAVQGATLAVVDLRGRVIACEHHAHETGGAAAVLAGVARRIPGFLAQHAAGRRPLGLGIATGGWGADWPDAWGWFDEIANGNAIASAGNTNISELDDPVVNGNLAKMQSPGLSQAQKNSVAQAIDMQVMKDAAILPAVYAKALLYRSPSLTNVMVQPYYGMYNYGYLGMK